MPKEQHHNHDIEKKAVYQLGAKLLDFGWIFRNQSESDFGIDAEIEKCVTSPEGKKHVIGEIFKAQIKGTEKLKTVSDESMVVLDLSKDELTYLCSELTVTPILFIVDVTNGRAFWFDVKEQGAQLLKEKPDNKEYRLKTPFDHEIVPENAARFYEHLHRAQYLTCRQGLARHLTEKEIATALLDLSSLQDVVVPPGHRVFSRPSNAYRVPRTVMSVSQGQTTMDIVQAENFKPGDEIKVKMLLEFPNDEEGKKARDEWVLHMKSGTPPILDIQKYAKNVRIVAGDKTIAEMGSARVQLGPVRNRMGLVLRSMKTGEQLFVGGESWSELPSRLCFDSSAFDETQAVHLSLTVELPGGQANFNISLNPQNIPTCADALYVMSLLETFNEGIELFMDQRGIQRKIAETDTVPGNMGFSEEGFDLVRRLALIEEKVGVSFPLAKVDEISKQEIENTIILSSLFSDETATVPMTLSATPEADTAITPEGQYVRVECPGELQFSILGHKIRWGDGLIAEGKCERFTQENDKGQARVQMYVPECHIKSMKSADQKPEKT